MTDFISIGSVEYLAKMFVLGYKYDIWTWCGCDDDNE